MAQTSSLIDRFWAKVEKTDTCWLWTACTVNGYGIFGAPWEVRSRHAHRFSYELARGPIPDGLHLDHLCRNRRCVNPNHLEPVTPGENMRRGESPSAIGWRTGHCRFGHPLEVRPDDPRRRICRVCHRRRAAERKRAKRLAA